jgi:hypothetical protein
MRLKTLFLVLGLVAGVCVAPNRGWTTVSNQATQTVTAFGNGSTTSFAITFDFRSNTWLTVTLFDTSTTPVTSSQVLQNNLSTGFQVSGGNPGTTIVMGTAPTTTQYLVISRSVPLTQPVVFNPASIFPYNGLSSELDALTLAIQDVGSNGGTSLDIPNTLVERDAYGNFAASVITANLVGNATSATTALNNANLTGPITSVGNATSIASKTGTGTTFVVNTAPTVSALTLTGITTLPNSSNIDASGNAVLNGTAGITLGSGSLTLNSGTSTKAYGLQVNTTLASGTAIGVNSSPNYTLTGSQNATDFYSNGFVDVISGTTANWTHYWAASGPVSGGTAARETGVYLQGVNAVGTDATNVAAITDSQAYTGAWFIDQVATDKSQFNGDVTLNGATTGLAVTNNATVGGTLVVTGAVSGSNLTAAGHASRDMTNVLGTVGSIIVASPSGTPSNLPGSAAAGRQFLVEAGPSTTPSWLPIVSGDIPTLNQNTSGTASNVTGIVAGANGGTGTNLFKQNFVLAGPAVAPSAAPSPRALVLADLPAQTGTGNVVLSASPTLSGTALAASLTLSGVVGMGATDSTAFFAINSNAAADPISTTSQRALYIEPGFNTSANANIFAIETNIQTSASPGPGNVLSYTSGGMSLASGAAAPTRYVDFYATGAANHVATSNAALADGVAFTSNWFINQAGADPSTLGGALTLSGTTTFPAGTTLDTSGNLVLGNTALGSTSLKVETNAASSANLGVFLQNTNTGNTQVNWLIADNQITGGALEFIPSTAAHGTTYSTPALRVNGTGTVAIPGVTTGTNADFACFASGGILQLQSTACTISSRRFKENIVDLPESGGLSDILALRPVQFNMKHLGAENGDPVNFYHTQPGLIAEEVAAVNKNLGVYEKDDKTLKSYRQEALIAELVKSVQQLEDRLETVEHACGR